MADLFDQNIPFKNRVEEAYSYQLSKNPVYRSFIDALGMGMDRIPMPEEIPLLPIRAFKDTRVICTGCSEKLLFKSSSTGGEGRSSHVIADPEIYRTSFRTEFYRHFPEQKYSILVYAPGYSQNPDSSLIWMLNDLVMNDPDGLSKFLPLNKPLSSETVGVITKAGKKVLLFGAAFGLLDLIELGSDPLPDSSHIIETGGMKTHRREISKNELRKSLSRGFEIPLSHVHSEYGMCEMQSQCYALGSEWFGSPHWVKVMIRDPENPLKNCPAGTEGKIGVIDLANVHSCPFILTEDRGVMNEDGKFRILGRWSSSNLRGCNFLIDVD
ncbi:hypothetical protein [Rhodohalobacter mucosus]|nr:hypothetical protein [Rhodohalobacter mucosus]